MPRTREVISRVKKFEDYYGFDIADTSNLNTKEDCKRAILHHRHWLETTMIDALSGIDEFITELGLDWIDSE